MNINYPLDYAFLFLVDFRLLWNLLGCVMKWFYIKLLQYSMEQWQKEREKQLLDFMVYKSSMILNELINAERLKIIMPDEKFEHFY